ncbi:hypothetical protein A0H81_09343 [Grifola frondosa]|uniref:LysM domain-containing protein n=1 Tax=Grifola frondosa TaxID=5627 RepID=A0A1C7M2B2_GRIFR|nr:hypothetical protein A0H81_09343 [Grifola frondosa]
MPFGIANGVDRNDSLLTRGNSFAGHSETSFSSAIKLKDTRPAVRRRGSDIAARRTRNDHDTWREGSSSHLRSRTVDSVGASSSHPLAFGHSSSSSVSSYGDDTRPSLKRLLSEPEAIRESSERPLLNSDGGMFDLTHPLSMEEEKLVLVHEVLPKDSLAGVALKYGVTLAELRRANQLWASDSIHLRKVLYIPIEKARPTKQFRADLIDSSISASSLEPPFELAPNARTKDGDLPGPSREAALDKFTFRRIPVSQLSFFPPSSNTAALFDTPSSHTHPRTHKLVSSRSALPLVYTESNSSTHSTSSNASSSPPRFASHAARSHVHSPGSLLTVNPIRIAQSARDALIARLSIESGSAAGSTANDDQEWGHEMEDVSAASSNSKTASGDDIHTLYKASNHHSSSRRHTSSNHADGMELDQYPSAPSQAHGYPVAHTSPQRAKKSPHPPSTPPGSNPHPLYSSPGRGGSSGAVRTAQLEPSPEMQLPLKARKAAESSS